MLEAAVVGGGIVGLAVARELLKRLPGARVAVLEKEMNVAAHQTGHNSGVIHAGVYYKPGSLRAKFCVQGAAKMYDYCSAQGVPHARVGKLIVATRESEVASLQALYARGQENGVPDLSLVDAAGISAIEPHCRGVLAIHSPHTGIVDYSAVSRAIASEITSDPDRGTVHLGFELKSASPTADGRGITLTSSSGASVTARRVVTCAGLYADRVARLLGGAVEPSVIPVRGEYLLLSPSSVADRVRGLIYPVPDPSMPFLGVHFTRRIDGSVDVGPNAVFAFAREGYSYGKVNLPDMIDALANARMRKLVAKHWKFGAGEYYRSLVPSAQLSVLRRYMPDLKRENLVKGPTGVRAQALAPDGGLLEDFILEKVSMGDAVALHVRNAPSPAATSSLAIAEAVVDKLLE